VGYIALDIGNSHTKGAVFEGNGLHHKMRWKGHPWPQLLSWAYNQSASHLIYCSVRPVPTSFKEALQRKLTCIELTHRTPLPFINRYHTPETLGKDRIAAAAGALQFFPHRHCVVVDVGTCLTIDLLTAQGEFLGGNISPGLHMRLQAMHTFTAQLPLPQTQAPPSWYGRHTHEAMQAGALYGLIWEVEGFVWHAQQMLGPVQVVATGGDVEIFAHNWKTEIFAHSDLVLIGLNKILKYNVEHTA